MKTPREILFERQRDAEPKLDALRERVLAALPASGSANRFRTKRTGGRSIRAVFETAWRELLWPSRRAWAGLAALWLGILAANLEMRAKFGPGPGAVVAAPACEIRMDLEAQRRMLAELLQPAGPAESQARRPSPNLRPRSERSLPFKHG